MQKIRCNTVKIPAKTSGSFIFANSANLPQIVKTEFHSKIKLIYIDPPFCTGSLFSSDTATAYNDRMPEAEYMQMMTQVLETAHNMLTDNGSIYLHIDYRMSAKLKLLLDSIFGEECFVNEIIWAYNSGGRAKTHFPRKHDTIFLYGKSKTPYFDIEATGIPRGKERRNNMKKNTDENGLVYYSIKSHGKEYRYYETDLTYPTDVWTDIPHLHQRDKERVNYPTQKPLALLNRIICASSDTDDIVCDLFSGSGTTATAAANSNRRFFSCDNSPLAMLTLMNRIFCENSQNYATFNIEACEQCLDTHINIENNHISTDLKADELMFISAGNISNGIYTPTVFSTSGVLKIPENTDKNALCVHIAARSAKHSFFIV